MPSIGDEVYRLGLDLSNEAMAAVEKLPYGHAVELLGATQQKFQSGHLKDPSNYICATVSRGYVPRSGSGQKGAIGAGGAKGGGGHKPGSDNYEAAAAALIQTPGMKKAEDAGVSLSDEAIQALLTIPASHASEILDAVAEKHQDLRDPSNYVIATINRGYVPRSEGGGAGKGGKAAGNLYETIYGSKGGGKQPHFEDHSKRSHSSVFSGPIGAGAGGYGSYGNSYSGSWSGGGGGGGGGHPHPTRRNTNLLPNDLSRVESAVLELNDQDLWAGQEINCATLLSLRCIPEDDAMELLQNLQGKGISKGSKGIGNLNNYIQAAVSKIAKEGGGGGGSGGHNGSTGGKGSGKNYTGNQSRQKAEELGLILSERSYETLARMPLRKATRLIEEAAQRQADGEDADHYIDREAQEDEPHSKRARVE
ncbi:unnamed protein product [Durusdinium trenchii]|uniref:RNA helicase n=2 Tax=Durusdinium trenchii TaxID=1381693 RepID=A0ABP0K4Y2_9DINO